MSERVPRLAVPVEVALYSSQCRKRPVIQHHTALNTVNSATYFHLERNAFAESVDITPLWIGNTPRRHHDFRDPLKELGRDLTAETANHAFEFRQVHRSWGNYAQRVAPSLSTMYCRTRSSPTRSCCIVSR